MLAPIFLGGGEGDVGLPRWQSWQCTEEARTCEA